MFKNVGKAVTLAQLEKTLKGDSFMSDRTTRVPIPHPGRPDSNGIGRHVGPTGTPNK